MENSMLDQCEALKEKILNSITVDETRVCTLCDQLIALARGIEDWQSVAFGYVWRADYQFYVALDIGATEVEINSAQKYIDESVPSELLEKFYTMKHLLSSNSFDVRASFRFCLRALDVAEKLNLKQRIGANYGNIGSYYLDYNCYEEALLYTEKSLKMVTSLPGSQVRMLRILLSNLIQINLKLGKLDAAKAVIEELVALPIEQKDLKIYVDYGKLRYYAHLQDVEKSLYYLQEMFDDGLMEFPNHAFVVEFLSNALEAMMRINQQEKCSELLDSLTQLVSGSEPELLLSVCQLKILYARQFGPEERLQAHYLEYYRLYGQVQENAKQLRVEGLRAKAKLEDTYMQFDQSKKELMELHELVNYDEMTQVYNRRYLNIRQEELLQEQETLLLGYVIFDVDYFKEYNDFYGHIAGDRVLIQVAKCLKQCRSDQIAVFRYGGDEFVALCWDADPNALGQYVKRVQQTLREENFEHVKSRCAQQVTLSIGFGSHTVADKADAFALFEAVDQALYVAKRNGRNNAQPIVNG